MTTVDIAPETSTDDVELLPEPTTEARRQVARLIDTYRWTVVLAGPRHARTVLTRFRWLEETARAHRRHGDHLAALLETRLRAFRAHWPHPPTEATLSLFQRDLEWLVRHDIPRIRRLLSGLTTGRRVQHAVEDKPPGTPKTLKRATKSGRQ